MAGLKQSRRVSWAPDVKLCQVRLFLSEDAPFQSGLATQENLQAKASWLMHATGVGIDDSLPPGFEAPHTAYQFRVELSQIPVVKWKCPDKVLLNPEWRVVAGEESEEVAVQNYRQLRVLEAIYPRQFNIPPDPSDLAEAQDSIFDDSQTPLIPITAIEDDDYSEQLMMPPTVTGSSQSHRLDAPGVPIINGLTDFRSNTEQFQSAAAQAFLSLPAETTSSGSLPIAEPDVVAAAAAAFTAIMRSSEEGSMIDRDLLINILRDPILVQKLVSEYGPRQTPSPAIPTTATSTFPQASFLPTPPQNNISTSQHLSAIGLSQVYPMPNMVSPMVSPVAVNAHPVSVNQVPGKTLTNPSSVRDINYYKSLIQQHGGETPMGVDINPVSAGNHQSNFISMDGVNSVNFGSKQQRDVKPKIPKPCIFFNSPKGCRRGDSCLYQHDNLVVQRIEPPKSSKRVKLDRGIAGRN